MEIDTSTTAGKIAVMSAFERGEKIEHGTRDQDGKSSYWHKWNSDTAPAWNWPYVDFRIAPKPDPYADLKADFERGEVIELNWSGDDEEPDWKISISPDWSCSPKEYRVKPTPKRVPLEAKDVPAPVCWIRLTGADGEVLVTGVYEGQLSFGSGRYEKFSDLMEGGWKYSADRKEWKECSKLEDAK